MEGDSVKMSVRLPASVADAVREKMTAWDCPASDVVVRILACSLGLPVPLTEYERRSAGQRRRQVNEQRRRAREGRAK